jgi:hypothetical protein
MSLGRGRYGARFGIAENGQNRVKEDLRGEPVQAARPLANRRRAAKNGWIAGTETRSGQNARPVRRTEHYALLELN